MRTYLGALACVLVLGACRAPRLDGSDPLPLSHDAVTAAAVAPLGADALDPRGGAAPGNAFGPGGFVPRGTARNFYAGAGGRLWYYLNHYYWVPAALPNDDLWIKAEVVEEFRDLRRWPDGASVPGPEPKVTVEYWKVGPNGRSLRLDNHKDYCLLEDGYTAGAIEVRATLELGTVLVADEKGGWERPREGYVLERRNYRKDRGIGPERTRFQGLADAPITVWGYRVPWSTHPERVTRSVWQDLRVPEWRLLATRPATPPTAPVVTAPDAPAASDLPK